MLKALAEAGIRPDVVLGTSIGAVNGALFAKDPTARGAAHLVDTWAGLDFDQLFPGNLWNKARAAIRQRTYVHANRHLASWLAEQLAPASTFEDLACSFQCVASCIEDSAERWFGSGALLRAILASSAVPGLLPPVEIAGKHYVDGGVVNSIPISRAYEIGAREVYVLHVGHVDDDLEVPKHPWDVGMVAFEIARRHRFTSDLESVPDGVTVHVLPTGATPGRFNDPAKLRYADLEDTIEQIASAYRATSAYLATG
jgi:NTE family protein